MDSVDLMIFRFQV